MNRFLYKIKLTINAIGMIYPKILAKMEYEKQSFSHLNERPVEFGFIFKHIVEIWPKTVLDVGTGKTALPFMMRNCGLVVTAIDNIKDYWEYGMVNRHYHVINDDVDLKLVDKLKENNKKIKEKENELNELNDNDKTDTDKYKRVEKEWSHL